MTSENLSCSNLKPDNISKSNTLINAKCKETPEAFNVNSKIGLFEDSSKKELLCSQVSTIAASSNSKHKKHDSFSKWRQPKCESKDTTGEKYSTLKTNLVVVNSGNVHSVNRNFKCADTTKLHSNDNIAETKHGNTTGKDIYLSTASKEPNSKAGILQNQLEKAKRLYHSVLIKNLPDSGARIKEQINDLELAIKKLNFENDAKKNNCAATEIAENKSQKLHLDSCKNYVDNQLSAHITLNKECVPVKPSSRTNETNIKFFKEHKSENGQKQLLHNETQVIIGGVVYSTIDSLEHQLSRMLQIQKSTNLTNLSDKGAKIEKRIKELQLGIEKLKANGSSTNLFLQNANSNNVKKNLPSKAQMCSVAPLPPHILSQMYRDKSKSNTSQLQNVPLPTQSLTESAIGNLHKQLELYPTDVSEEDPNGLKSLLMPHQKQALVWLLWREKNIPAGGILADDMGLGKTLTMISLIVKQKEALSLRGKRSGVTLVVCPASLIHQWMSEIERHCAENLLKVLLYHGSDREKNVNRIVEFDVVVTTFNIISKEINAKYNKDKEIPKLSGRIASEVDCPLLKIEWERIILDEAHNIKNHKSVTSQSVFMLRSRYKWALTGTPIHNNLMDMYALIKFLNFSPFDEYSTWKKWVEASRLSVLLDCILLRREKSERTKDGASLVNLPKKTFTEISIKLSEKENDVYQRLYALSKNTLALYIQEREGKNSLGCKKTSRDNKNSTDNYSSCEKNKLLPEHYMKPRGSLLLVLLLRLQQCCCHLSLLSKTDPEETLHSFNESESIDLDLSSQLSGLSLQENKMKDVKVHSSHTFSLSDLKLESYKSDSEFSISSMSSKLRKILSTLNDIKKKDTKDKSVIVSQWVLMLDTVAFHLNNMNVKYHFINGSTSLKKRMEAVVDFNTNPDGPKVMLLSLKAGGVGLNLIGGNHLLLPDFHWNPALESQACDRVYRIGQKKDVHIYKFICEDTIETKIIQLQKDKAAMANSVLKSNVANKKSLTLPDMLDIFGL